MNSIYKKNILSWFKKKRIPIDEKADLFASNKIDSFNFIELLVYIEQKHKLKLKHESIFLKTKLYLKDLILILEKSENKKIKKK